VLDTDDQLLALVLLTVVRLLDVVPGPHYHGSEMSEPRNKYGMSCQGSCLTTFIRCCQVQKPKYNRFLQAMTSVFHTDLSGGE
jgi:hypothetical protein